MAMALDPDGQYTHVPGLALCSLAHRVACAKGGESLVDHTMAVARGRTMSQLF